jgi:hypothetical protein
MTPEDEVAGTFVEEVQTWLRLYTTVWIEMNHKCLRCDRLAMFEIIYGGKVCGEHLPTRYV